MLYVRWIIASFLIIAWLIASIGNVRLFMRETSDKPIGGSPDMPLPIPFPCVLGIIGFLIAPFPYHFYFAPAALVFDPFNWYTLLYLRKKYPST